MGETNFRSRRPTFTLMATLIRRTIRIRSVWVYSRMSIAIPRSRTLDDKLAMVSSNTWHRILLNRCETDLRASAMSSFRRVWIRLGHFCAVPELQLYSSFPPEYRRENYQQVLAEDLRWPIFPTGFLKDSKEEKMFSAPRRLYPAGFRRLLRSYKNVDHQNVFCERMGRGIPTARRDIDTVLDRNPLACTTKMAGRGAETDEPLLSPDFVHLIGEKA